MEIPDRAKYAVIVSSLKRGDLLIWKNFAFPNGTTKDKIVLVLSNCVCGEYFLAALPTSHYEKYVSGATLVDTVCFPRGSSPTFSKDTVVDLKNMHRITVNDLVKMLGRGVSTRDCVTPDEWTAIEECIRNAKTLTPQEKSMILES